MRVSKLGACLIALMAVACGGVAETQSLTESSRGVLQLPLTTIGPEGHFRLVGASFTITGPESKTITDTSADTLNVPLQVGDYTLALGGEWRLERVSAPGTTVDAELVSPTLLPFSVFEDQPTSVRFLFKLKGKGSTDVGFSVDDGGYLSGTLVFTQYNGPPDSPVYAALVGKSVPFVIAFESSQVSRRDSGGFQKEVQVMAPGFLSVQFGGPYAGVLNQDVAPFLRNELLTFFVRVEPSGKQTLHSFSLNHLPLSVGILVDPSQPFTGAIDSEGYPLGGFQFQSTLRLRARGNAELMATIDAKVEPR